MGFAVHIYANRERVSPGINRSRSPLDARWMFESIDIDHDNAVSIIRTRSRSLRSIFLGFLAD